ncbi:PTS sugar transporter subunit IIA [Enterococcus pallens]|nr:hypothetical protein RV10_GL002691 [Enterococcus pallens]
MTLNVKDILREDLVDLSVEAASCTDLFMRISDVLFSKGYVVQEYGQQLQKREHAFPTGLATKTVDVAIPHTDAVFVKEPFVYVLKPKTKIAFHQMGTFPENGVLVHPKLIFILGFSKNDMQLALLQTLMKIFNDETMMDQLIEAETEKELFELLRKQIDDIGGEKE